MRPFDARHPFDILLAAATCLLLPACGSSLAGPGPSDFPRIPPLQETRLPDETVAAYDEDAARLALRYLERRKELAEWPIDIPDDLRSSLRAALLRVASSAGAPRDSVVELFGIHTFSRPALHELIVSAEAGAGWIEAWREGRTLTGKEGIDRLIERWGLELVDFSDLGTTPWGVLRSERPLNLAALGREFERVSGVRFAEPNGIAGDGNDITAEADAGAWRLSFSVGFGDCPAGCISRHFWHFRVGSDGSVAYEGSSGDPLP